MQYPNLQKLVMSFPSQELDQYRQRLQGGGSAYTTRISKERNKYKSDPTYDSDLGPILIEAIQPGRGLKTHPFVAELSPEQQDQIKRKAYDLIKFKLNTSGPAIQVQDGIISINKPKLDLLKQHGRDQDAIAFVEALRDAGIALGEYDKEKEYNWVKQNRPEVWERRLKEEELENIYSGKYNGLKELVE